MSDIEKQKLINYCFTDSARGVCVRSEGRRRTDLHHHGRSRPSRVDGLAPRSPSAFFGKQLFTKIVLNAFLLK